MKEQILAKIAEMQAENSRRFDLFNNMMAEHNVYEYFSEDYDEGCRDFQAGGYDGDSLSHMLDILIEQDYVLDQLARFISVLEES